VADEYGEVRDDKLDAQQAARRRLALAQIRQYPDPVLRMSARDVEVFDEDLVRLVDRMKALMEDAHGVGLAATQVGVLQRLFVLKPDEGDAQALVNPRIVEASADTTTDDEGCLSLQGVLVPVERQASLTVEAVDEHGKPVRLELTELAARVVQHELDHLDGRLIIDRTDAASRREALATLRPQPLLG
jgi:peptide deformylase